MTPKEEPIYVGIENPSELRRALLESSKNLIHILQANEKAKGRRKRKEALVIELKESKKELNRLVSQLKGLMPKVKTSSLPKKYQAARPKQNEDQQESMPSAPRQRRPRINEAQKLENELKEIEDKLSRL